jgi:hypothetical protein
MVLRGNYRERVVHSIARRCRVTIPEGPFWAIVIALVAGLGALIWRSWRNTWSVSQKVDREDCLRQHGALSTEIMAMSKDIEALVRANGIDPHPRPRGGVK